MSDKDVNNILESISVNGVEETKKRIYDYLPGKLKIIPTRKGIKKALKKKIILLNGRPAFSGDYVKND
ncbi:MAG: hypothetical protein R3277_09175, partial [Brumimicrobium sp.]|nr:hypothetical protein [Brumimicrobium sp.]